MHLYMLILKLEKTSAVKICLKRVKLAKKNQLRSALLNTRLENKKHKIYSIRPYIDDVPHCSFSLDCSGFRSS